MSDARAHPWDLTPARAALVQRELARLVVAQGELPEVRTLAAVDVSHNPYDPSGTVYAAAVLLSYPYLELLEGASVQQVVRFPYIPGLLAFREGPVVALALEKLRGTPDVIICDGHGLSHPRGLGIASHLGVRLDQVTIGCAKTLLCGAVGPLLEAAGAQAPIVFQGRTVGMALRTRTKVQPIYVSAGHRISLDAAVRFIWTCLDGMRLPVPIRCAHEHANRARLAHQK